MVVKTCCGSFVSFACCDSSTSAVPPASVSSVSPPHTSVSQAATSSSGGTDDHELVAILEADASRLTAIENKYADFATTLTASAGGGPHVTVSSPSAFHCVYTRQPGTSAVGTGTGVRARARVHAPAAFTRTLWQRWVIRPRIGTSRRLSDAGHICSVTGRHDRRPSQLAAPAGRADGKAAQPQRPLRCVVWLRLRVRS